LGTQAVKRLFKELFVMKKKTVQSIEDPGWEDKQTLFCGFWRTKFKVVVISALIFLAAIHSNRVLAEDGKAPAHCRIGAYITSIN
jgi:hypothetical protein